MEIVHINIWDDFKDDFAHDGEVQKTYAYVEESEITHDEEKEYLHIFYKNYIENNSIFKNVDAKIEFHDTKDDYESDLVERAIKEYGEKFFFKRWEIKFKNLTHQNIHDFLLEFENKSDVNVTFKVYSES